MALLVLSAGDSVGLSLGSFNIVGTRTGSETVVLNAPTSGNLTVTLDPSFNQGGDTIVLAGTASDYSAVRSGSSIVLTSGSISVTIPVGTAGAQVVFANGAGAGDDDARTLLFDPQQGAIFLGGQDIGFQSEQVDGGGAPPAGVTVAVDSPVVTEGDTGNKLVTFTLTLSEAPTAATTVTYSTAPGTATANDDYIPQSGSVNFAPGQTTATVSVSVLGDTIDEADETFTLTANVGGQSATGTATILDNDDAAPVVQSTLTPGQDTIVGTAGNDLFLAQNGNLNAGDSIDGLAGEDTLQVSADGTVDGVGRQTYAGFTTTSVENFVVTDDSDNGVIVDLSGTTGLQTVTSVNSSAGTDFRQIPNIVDLTLDNLTNDVDPVNVVVRFQNAVVAGVTAPLTLNVSESFVDSVQIGSNAGANNTGIETLNLVVTGDSTIDLLDADVTTLNIDGTGDIAINDLVAVGGPQNLTTVDGTNASGALTIDYSDAANAVTFTGSNGNDTVTGSQNGDIYNTRVGDDTVNAGVGDDDITTGAGDDIVNTGAGNDTVNTGDDNDIVNVEAGSLSTNINLGSGNDSVEFAAGTFNAPIAITGAPTEDSLDGGTDADGFDRDELILNESEVDTSFAAVKNMEILSLNAGGTSQQLANNFQAAGFNTINLSTGDDAVFAGNVNTGLTINSRPGDGTALNGGDDDVSTGDGDDVFNFGGDLTDGDDLDAGPGNDTLNLDGTTTLAQNFGAVFFDFEQLNLMGTAADTDYDLTLINSNDPNGATASRETLTIDGSTLDADDNVDLDTTAVTTFDLNVTTGAADDVVALGGTDNTVVTNDGDDFVLGNLATGQSDISTGDGDDTVNVQTTTGGSVIIDSGADNDTVVASGTGAKDITLGDGNDFVLAGNDATIDAGAGNDEIIVSATDGSGNLITLNNGQTVDGGDGIDKIVTEAAVTADALFTNFSDVEVFVQANQPGNSTLGAEAQEAGIRTIVDADNGGTSTFDASTFSEDVTVNLEGITAETGPFAGVFLAGGGDDRVLTGSGNDRVILANGDNALSLGMGNDIVEVEGSELDLDDEIAGGAGTDEVELNNSGGAVTAQVDLSQVTSVEQYTLTSNGDRAVGVDTDINSLVFSDQSGGGDALVGTITDINIDNSLLTDADDLMFVTIDPTLQDGDFRFIVSGAGAGVDVTVVKGNVDVDNNVVFNGAASNDSLVINGDDLGSTIAFTGGAGIDTIVQRGGVINDDGYRGISGVEVLRGDLNATLGQQAEFANSGLTTIIGAGGDDNVQIDSAFDGTYSVDLGQFGGDMFNGSASDAVFNFVMRDELDANDSLSGGSTASDTLQVGRVGSATDATTVTQVETINVLTVDAATPGQANTLIIDTLVSEVTGGRQTINALFGPDADNFTLTGGAATAALSVNLSGVADANITTGTGNDLIAGLNTSGTMTVRSGAGADQVTAGAGVLEAFGGAGNDTLMGGAFDDLLAGGAGIDMITGGAGDDDIFGGNGADILSDGTGMDRIQGGNGQDTITLTNDNVMDVLFYDAVTDSSTAFGRDTVTGFESGIDQIDITAVDGAPAGATINFLGNVNSFADAESSLLAADGMVDAVYDQVNDILYFDINDDGNLDAADIQIALSTEGNTGLVAADVMDGAAIVGGDSAVVTDNAPNPFTAAELQVA